jgi:hypothetical protein
MVLAFWFCVFDVIDQPRQQSDAREIHRLKDGFMDAWDNHETKY